MKCNPDIHNRKSLRLKDYDYSQNWLYFITIAIQNKLCLLWEIKNSELHLFESWKMIIDEWMQWEEKYKNIVLHNFIVMPNHFHGIIEIIDDGNDVNNKTGIDENRENIIVNTGTNKGHPYGANRENIIVKMGTHKGHPYDTNRENTNVGAIPCGCPKKQIILWDIIWWFKSITTNEYIKNVANNNWLPFNKKLWQRNYYEHIIRNEDSYIKICEYIQNNPKKWDEDKFYFTEI